jgi:radical SAM family uncharacterized protein/radical SAM-linked protein
MRFLTRFERPSRYINGEINSIHRDAPLRMALAFPDTYEVGMSHLGLKILYGIVNDLPYASCERVFHPWTDLEEHMRRSGAPLCSIEGRRPLSEFDAVGFSLQYELSYTSILNMLSLGGIPLKSEERTDGHPIVLAGGPCAVNPAPLSPFIDAFLIGDGEEAVPEIMEALWRLKRAGDGKRDTALRELAKIPGVYVPRFHEPGKRIARRFIASLEDAPFPTSTVLPFTPLVHDRVNIEVSRGCTMGCRFCQAGMIYRPLRERSPRRVLELAEASIKATGYDEVSFTSLSAGDYSCLLPLLREFNRRFAGRMLSLSLPSLRVKAVNGDMLKEIKSVRKTGFTIAPEAATERLRMVINKDFSEEDYIDALNALFREGWLNIKLYFMIGLPTETGEDVEAIPRMAMKALHTAKRYTGRFVNVNVGVSSFVPKPHTPFAWHPQEDIGELRRKKSFLFSALKRKNLNFKSHDERMSLLEAAFSRGDCVNMPELLLAAHALGARLDGWSECFDFDLWQRAMDKTGVDAASFAKKRYEMDEPFPWDIVDTGVSRKFLQREYGKALSPAMTPDCRAACPACGLDCKTIVCEMKETVCEIKADQTSLRSVPTADVFRLRFEFSKTGRLALLSHREVITAVTRAARRAGLPLDYSKGFHPAPRIAFGLPLGVGVEGLREYFDASLTVCMAPDDARDALNRELPEGLGINRAVCLPERAESLQSFISSYEYEIIGIDASRCAEFLEKGELIVDRDGRGVDLKAMVGAVEPVGKNSARLVLRDTESAKVRLEEAVTAIFGMGLHEVEARRVAMWAVRDGVRLSPV